MDGVVIHRTDDAAPGLQVFHSLDEQIRVEGVRVVVIELCPLLVAHVVVGLIVVVVVNDGHVPAETLHELFGDGGFAAAGASGDSDDHYFVHGHTPCIFLSKLIVAYTPPCFNLTFTFFYSIIQNM